MANPEANSVRNLASRYHLSIKRVDAILRLKGLEENWIKVRALSLVSLARGSGRVMFTKISLEDSKMVIPRFRLTLSRHSHEHYALTLSLSGGITVPCLKFINLY